MSSGPGMSVAAVGIFRGDQHRALYSRLRVPTPSCCLHVCRFARQVIVSSLLPRLVRQRSRQLLRQHVGRCLRRPPPIQLCPFEKLILTCRQGSWHLRWESSPGFRCMHSGCRSCCLDRGQLVVLVEVSMRKTAAPSPYDKVPAQVVRPATLCPESTIETSHASFISIHQCYIATLYLMYAGGTLSPSQH